MDASILTRKIGPLPAWVWGGLAAVGLWWFVLRNRGSSSTSTSTQNAAASGSALDSGYSLGYAQGVQANPPLSGTTTTTTAAANFVPNLGGVGVWLFRSPAFTGQSNVAAVLPPGTKVPTGGSAVSGATYTDPFGNSGSTWQPVNYNGQTLYAFAPQLAPVGTAVGGPGTSRKHAIGSRAAAGHLSDAHPLVGAPVRYAHYVRAVGGPRNHRHEVARVAQQAGVHPARIAMLNPEYTGRIRVA